MNSNFDFLLDNLIDEVKDIYSYIGFSKQYMKYNFQTNKIEDYIQRNGKGKNATYHFNDNNLKDKILNYFPFLKNNNYDNSELAKYLWEYKNDSFEIFPFNWLKKEILKNNFIFNKQLIEKISGVIFDSNDELKNFIKSLIPNSFIIHAKIKLKSPYYSSDDDHFYIIDNPCLKEKVFKVPMVRGSGWKGAIAACFRDLINESNDKRKLIQSYLRIFGAGSDEFRKLKESINEYLKKDKNFNFDRIINFLLFELGLKLTKNEIDTLKDSKVIVRWLEKNLWDKLQDSPTKKEIPLYLQTHRGRAIFYPTYFNKLSLEIINPHSRKTRAGTVPIHYEVVPEDAEGILQIVYIPFDGILKKSEEIKKETEKDLKNLIDAIEKTKDKGVGAKEKLGWGRFEIVNKKIYLNENLKIPEGWAL